MFMNVNKHMKSHFGISGQLLWNQKMFFIIYLKSLIWLLLLLLKSSCATKETSFFSELIFVFRFV